MSHILCQVPAVVVVHDDAQVAGCAEYFLQAQSSAVGHTRFDSTTGHTTWKPKLQTSAKKTLHFSAVLIVFDFYLQFPDPLAPINRRHPGADIDTPTCSCTTWGCCRHLRCVRSSAMTAGPDSSSSSSRNFIATFCPVSLFSASCTKLMLPLRIRPQRRQQPHR